MVDCQTGQTWTNVSQTLKAQAFKTCQASSVQQLIEIVRAAVSDGKRIRVAGGGHSWYPLVLTQDQIEPDDNDYYLVTVADMKTVTTEVTANGLNLVHIQPGATMGDVQQATLGDWPNNPPAHPMAFPTNGVIPEGIQEGGFIAAGCHGTGWQQPTVPDLMYAVEMIVVDIDKTVKVQTFSETDTPDIMDVIRVNLGAIGIMTKITLRAEPLFCMHAVDSIRPMAEIVSRNPSSSSHPLKDLVESADTEYVELFWFPYNATKPYSDTTQHLLPWGIPDVGNTKVWVKTAHRLPGTSGCPEGVPSQAWDKLAAEFGKGIYQAVAEHPSALFTPPVLQFMGATAYATAKADFVAPAPRVFHYQSVAFPVLDFSFAIPMDPNVDPNFNKVSDAWYAVVDAVVDWAKHKPDNHKFPVNVTLHARFIKNSQSLLSPAYQPSGSNTHTCWIEFLSGAPTPPNGSDWYHEFIEMWTAFCQLIGPQWMALGGRPHWAKQWQVLANQGIYSHIRKSYGANLDTFKTERDKLDPNGVFLNRYIEKIFTG